LKSRAFTLIEVLVVLTLIGLTFSVLLLVFSRGVDSSLSLSGSSRSLVERASLFWDLQRKILGANKIEVSGNALYMITSGGTLYEGVVKCAYIFRDGRLFYYEFPYPYGALDEVEEEKLQELGKVSEFRVLAVVGNREEKFYEGIPDYIKVHINGEEMVFQTLR